MKSKKEDDIDRHYSCCIRALPKAYQRYIFLRLDGLSKNAILKISCIVHLKITIKGHPECHVKLAI
jgi:hypothetical protein